MSKLITARKGYKKPRNGPLFAQRVDRINNNIFDGADGGMIDMSKISMPTVGISTVNPIPVQGITAPKSLFNPIKTPKVGGIKGLNSKIKGTKGASAAISAGATLVGGLANKGISGGLESQAGSMISTLGGTAGNIVGQFNPIAGAAVTLGSQVLGGLTNRAFGMKTNVAALNAANEGTAALNNFRSNAQTFDDVQGPATVSVVENAYKGGWFSSGKARRKNAELRAQRAIAQAWANRSVNNNVINLQQDQMNNALANYAALGGWLGGIDPTSPIGYSMLTDMEKIQQDKVNSKNMSTIPSILAFGGNVESNGATWSDGMTHINVGGSHEENPNEGVQLGVDNQGTPNLVEEGEVIYNDYVFSNRLTVPVIKKKKDLSQEERVLKKYSDNTYAKAAKRAEKDSGVTDRPNDLIAKRGFEATLQILATSQEREREKQKLKELQEAIDNMSPEELAALQQQMQAMQQQSQEEAIAQQQAQQQQASPEEMQQMSPEEAQQMQQMQQAQQMQADQQPVAALGGILSTPDNMYPYGGSFEDFTKELANKGISMEDFLYAVLRSQYAKDLMPDEDVRNLAKASLDTVNAQTFDNYKDFAEKFLSSQESSKQLTEEQLKLRKSLERKYKKGTKNFDYDKLSGHGKAAFDADLQKVLENPDLLKEDKDNQLSISRYGEAKPDISFSHFATNEARDSYLPEISLNDNGKLDIQYKDGVIPQGLSFLNDGVTYDKEKGWLNRKGESVENPFTKEYGFTNPARDWNSWGYIDSNGDWQSIDAPTPSTSGNTDFKFTPTAEWAKDLGEASKYEQQDHYIDNYIDFIEALNNGDQDALKRLYTIGEATKSNNPEDRAGKNRYFVEGADYDNLKKEDVIGYNPNEPENGIFGNSYWASLFGVDLDSQQSSKIFTKDKEGNVASWKPEEWDNLSEENKKDYTILGKPNRENLREFLKSSINYYPESYSFDKDDLYFQGISDNVWGPHHLEANKATNRYAYVDAQGNYLKDADGNIRYIDYNPEANYNYYNNKTPIETQTVNGTTLNTIGILGGDVSNNIGVRKNPDGTWKTYRLTDEQAEKLKQREILNSDERYKTLPQFEDAVEGYNFTPHYFELDDDAYKSAGFDDEGYKAPKATTDTESDPFPKAQNWPYLAAGLAQLGALGYNILSPSDYSNANAMIKAGMQAGNYMPVSYTPRGNFHVYKPDDPWFYTSPIIAQGNSAQRLLANKVSPSKGAEILANTYNTQLALGKATRQALEHNDEKEFKDIEANNALGNTWSEGFLKADMANQDAFARAQGFSLEGQKAGYAMKQAIDDAKAAGINAGISGLINLLPAYAQNKYNQDMIGWGIRNGAYAPQDVGYWAKKSQAAEGGKIKRNKKKGLNF